jgi:hypothetical protein
VELDYGLIETWSISESPRGTGCRALTHRHTGSDRTQTVALCRPVHTYATTLSSSLSLDTVLCHGRPCVAS